jgi:chromosome segregation ATPase
MAAVSKLIFVLGAVIFLFAGTAVAQDSPSLGDLARQQRQQSKTAKGKDAKGSKVITNEEIPEHRVSAPSPAGDEYGSSMPASSSGAKQPAESWKSQIQAQKSQIASLQKQIDQVNESIRFAPANCVGRCAEWNERQREKQQQVERMQAQLDEQKKRMEEMQESARKQGYGSSVYDP